MWYGQISKVALSKLKHLFALILLLISFRFFFGVYQHDEFNESTIFLKHRPVWKWHFYSPIGMTDLTLDDLDSNRKNEQLYFNEFITEEGLGR